MFVDLGYCKIVFDRFFVISFIRVDCWCVLGFGVICIFFFLKMFYVCMKVVLFMIKNLILKLYYLGLYLGLIVLVILGNMFNLFMF